MSGKGRFLPGYDPRRVTGAKPGLGRKKGEGSLAWIERMKWLSEQTVPEEILATLDPSELRALLTVNAELFFKLERLRLDAWELVANRAWGMPTVTVVRDTDAERRAKLRGMSNEELIEHLKTVSEPQAATDEPEPPESGAPPLPEGPRE